MITDAAVVLSALLLMGVVVVKVVTAHRIAISRSELVKLEQIRDAVVEKLNMVKERRIAAEGNRDFLERRKSEQLDRQEQLAREIEKYAGQVAGPEEGIGFGQGGGQEPA